MNTNIVDRNCLNVDNNCMNVCNPNLETKPPQMKTNEMSQSLTMPAQNAVKHINHTISSSDPETTKPEPEQDTTKSPYSSKNIYCVLNNDSPGNSDQSDIKGNSFCQVSAHEKTLTTPLRDNMPRKETGEDRLKRALKAKRLHNKNKTRVLHIFCENCSTFFADEIVGNYDKFPTNEATVYNCEEHENASETVFLTESYGPKNCIEIELPNRSKKLFMVDSGASSSVLPDKYVHELRDYIRKVENYKPKYVRTASRYEKVQGEYEMTFRVKGETHSKYRFLNIKSCTRAILGLDWLRNQDQASYHFHRDILELNGEEIELQAMPRDTVLVKTIEDNVILPQHSQYIDIKLEMKKQNGKINPDCYANIDTHMVYASETFAQANPDLLVVPNFVNQRRTLIEVQNQTGAPILIEKGTKIAVASRQAASDLMSLDKLEEMESYYLNEFQHLTDEQKVEITKDLYNPSASEEELARAEKVYQCHLHRHLLMDEDNTYDEQEDQAYKVDHIFATDTDNMPHVENIGPEDYAQNFGYGEYPKYSFKPEVYASQLIPGVSNNAASDASDHTDQPPEQVFASEPVENPDEIPILSDEEMKSLRQSMHDLPPSVDLKGLTNKDIAKIREMCKIEFKSGSKDPSINKRLRTMILERHRAFCTGFNNIGMVKGFEWEVETINKDNVVIKRPYPLHPKIERLIDAEISDQMKNGLLLATTIGNRSPCLAVPKKNDQTQKKRIRLLSDFRCVNKGVVKQSWPLPSFSNIIDWFAHEKPKYLSTLDIFSGYSQIKLSENSQKLVGTVTRTQQFTYARAPQGLASSSAVFLKKMHERMGATVQKNRSVTWCDDFLVGSSTEEEMINNIEQILLCAEENGITFSAFKGNFLKQEVDFAGCYWTPNGVKADDSKVKVMKEFPTPKTRKQLRSFLGLASWFRSFIQNFAKIAAPLYDSTKGTNQEKFLWSEKQENAFKELKETMSSSPVISYPRENLPIYIFCDASDVALGWIICQYDDPNITKDLTRNKTIPKTPAEIEKLKLKGVILGYGSKKLDEGDKRKSIHWKECKAIQLALRHFHAWTSHSEVHVLTDRSSILDLFKSGRQKKPHYNTQVIDRILLELEFYNLSIQYIPTDKNPSDCISRTENLPQSVIRHGRF